MDETVGAGSSPGNLRDIAPISAHSRAQTAAANTHRGKGNHISALRSLGLLHELQEYVAACVETQQQQEKELGKLKAEKKDIEKALKQKASRSSEKQPCIQQFQASEISDLPPRIRALFEDNKVLKEQTRRYKQRLHEAERNAAGLEQQLLAAQSANSKLKVQLQEGDAGQEAEELAQARQQAESLAKAVEKLQHANQVLQQKLETDARLHRQAQASANKDRLQLEEQIQELQGQLETKEKEARGHALTAKLAQRKLEEVKASAAKAVAGVHARVAEAVAAAEARHKQQDEARVHLMLCVIREPEEATPQGKPVVQPAQHEGPHRPAANIWSDDSSTDVSKHTSNSSYTGNLSRDQAVLRLQASARGYLARKQMRLQRQQQADTFVLVQGGQQRLQDSVLEQAEAASRQVAVAGTSASGNLSAFGLPMELPTLDTANTAAATGCRISRQPSTTSASAFAGAASKGRHLQVAAAAAAAAAPSAGKPVVPVPISKPVRQQSAAPVSAARKPSLPVFSRAPPTPVLNSRAPRPDSSVLAGSSSSSSSAGRVSRSGPGGRAAAAGPSILASSASSRAASPSLSVLAASPSSKAGSGHAPVAQHAAASILAAVSPAVGEGAANNGAAAGTRSGRQGMQRTNSGSRSRSRSPAGSVTGDPAGGCSLQRANSGSSLASLPLQRTNSANSRGVAALAVPPVGSTVGQSLQRTNSNSSQRSVGSTSALPALGKQLQRTNSINSQKSAGSVSGAKAAAAGKAQQRPSSGSRVNKSAAGAAASQASVQANKQQQQQQPGKQRRQPQPPAAKPQMQQQQAAFNSPRRQNARLSRIPQA